MKSVLGSEEEKMKSLEDRFSEKELAQTVSAFAHILATSVTKS